MIFFKYVNLRQVLENKQNAPKSDKDKYKAAQAEIKKNCMAIV